MAVYTTPDGIEIPNVKWEGANIAQRIKEADDKYRAELKAWCIERNPEQEHVGEIVRYPVADGTAEYMVAATKPLQLIHLETGDKYWYEGIERFKLKDILKKIDQQKSLEAFLAENRAKREAEQTEIK